VEQVVEGRRRIASKTDIVSLILQEKPIVHAAV